MVYIGSKSKYTSYIIPILQNIIDKYNIQTYIEPFVGGANVIDKIKCNSKIGYDKNITLIALHQQGQTAPESIPPHGNRDWWDKAKSIYRIHEGAPTMENDMELWRIGAIQFFGSFSRGGFSRGFANNTNGRDYYNQAYKNFMEQIKQPLYKDIKFYWSDYKNLPNYKNCLIYCDPPYQNTKAYGYKFETDFNYNHYWNWVRDLSKENWVVCSEQTFPEDFNIIWQQDVKRTNGSDNNYKAIEKLGIWNKGKLI